MQQPETAAKLVRTRKLELDLRTGELWKNGARTRLPEQARQILAILIANAGELVTREDLRRALWPSDTFVDFEHGLNTAMMRLRQALGDSPEHPRYIETMLRRGYRFIAPIEELSSSTSASVSSEPVLPVAPEVAGRPLD
jgi:DNA-binding winged helix-turn-helix (wHTH) protein